MKFVAASVKFKFKFWVCFLKRLGVLSGCVFVCADKSGTPTLRARCPSCVARWGVVGREAEGQWRDIHPHKQSYEGDHGPPALLGGDVTLDESAQGCLGQGHKEKDTDKEIRGRGTCGPTGLD